MFWIFFFLFLGLLILLTVFFIYNTCSTSYFQTATEFITWTGKGFAFSQSQKPFSVVGFNAHWLGLIPSDTGIDYPTDTNIESAFQIAQKYGATVIRSISLGFSIGKSKTLLPSTQGDINQDAWQPIDSAFRYAQQYGVYLILTLLDPYDYYTGNMWEYLKPYGLTDKSLFYTDARVIQDFKNYIRQYLSHEIDGVKMSDNPFLLMIELGNELDDHGFPSVLTSWLQDISSFIRTLDTHHLILSPLDVGVVSADFEALPDIDVFSQHYYNYTTEPSCQWCMSADNKNQLKVVSQKVTDAGKAYIIGEYASCYAKSPCDAIDFIESLEISSRPTVHGDLFWEYIFQDAPFGTPRGQECRCADDGDYQDIRDDSDPRWSVFQRHWERVKSKGNMCMSLDQCTIQCGKSPPASSVTIVAIGDSITAGYNCGVNVPGKGSDQCSTSTQGRTCDGEMRDCDFSLSTLVSNEQKYTNSFYRGSTYFPNCSLSYLDFMTQSLEANGFTIQLYNMGISGAQAGGCSSFNQSYKSGGMTPGGVPTHCWDQIFSQTFQSPLFFLFMLGTNDAIQQYVNSCFSGDVTTATQSYFQSVLSMLTDIRQKFSDAYIVLMRPIKNFAYQVQPNVYFYDDMLNETYQGLESFIRQSSQFQDDARFVFIDLWTFTDKTIPEESSLSYTCDYTHPTDNLNKMIGEYIAQELIQYFPKVDMFNSSENTSLYFKCSI